MEVIRMQGTRRKKNQKKTGSLGIVLIAAVIFLTGAAVFLYPAVSNWLAEIHQSDVIQEYEDEVAEKNPEDYEEAWRLAQEYNENLAGDPVHDPFVPGSGYALPENYLECLNIDGSGVMGFIEIPKIAVRLPIYHGTSEEMLEKGVGHVESTALPIGGDFTHAVLTGHRGLPSAKLFTDLDQMEIGDQFYIHVLDQILAYEVDEINTVLPDELKELRTIEGRDLVTLVTCTPYGVNTHRLLVRGTRVPYIPQEAEAYRQSVGTVSVFGLDMRLQYLGAAVGGFILLIIIIVVLVCKRHRKKGGRYEA
jgi:sortase A